MGCRKCDCLLAFISALTVAVGIVLMVMGIVGVVKEAEIREYTGGASWLWFLYTIIVVGIVILIVGCVGWAAGFARCLRLAYLYVALIVIIILVQLGLGLFGYIKRDKIPEKVDMYVNSTFNSSDFGSMSAKQQTTINIIQKNLECCGREGPNSWVGAIPQTCCRAVMDANGGNTTNNTTDNTNNSTNNGTDSGDISKRETDSAATGDGKTCANKDVFQDGCRMATRDYLEAKHMCFIYFLLGGLILELMCGIIACFVARNAHRTKIRYHRAE